LAKALDDLTRTVDEVRDSPEFDDLKVRQPGCVALPRRAAVLTVRVIRRMRASTQETEEFKGAAALVGAK